MRVLFLGWIITLSLSLADVHAQFLTRSVVSALGTNIGISGIFVSCTMGESISGTLGCSQVYLTQGFQQPLSNISIEPPDINFDAIDIYPNPFKDKINVIIEVKDINNYYIDVFSIQGRKLDSFKLTDIFSGIYEINMEKLPPGVYLLQIRSSFLKTNRTFRIVKI